MTKNKKKTDAFINIKLYRFPSVYHIRKAILNFLENQKSNFSGKILDLGCGGKPYQNMILSFEGIKEYIGLDIESALIYKENIKPEFYWDGTKIPFEDNTFNTVLVTEVLEHCPYPQEVISEIYRVLKKDGHLILSVPFLFPLHEIPNDEFRFTPFSLERILKNSGFLNIYIKATGGWRASLGQVIGLFLFHSKSRSNSEKILRKIIKPLAIIFMFFLYKTDVVPKNFDDDVLITGLTAVANK